MDIDEAALRRHLEDAPLNASRSWWDQDKANKEATRTKISTFWNSYATNARENILDLTVAIEGDITSALSGENEDIVFLRQSFPMRIDNVAYTGINYVLIVKGEKWGTVDDKPILLGAHYDTRPNSPG